MLYAFIHWVEKSQRSQPFFSLVLKIAVFEHDDSIGAQSPPASPLISPRCTGSFIAEAALYPMILDDAEMRFSFFSDQIPKLCFSAEEIDLKVENNKPPPVAVTRPQTKGRVVKLVFFAPTNVPMIANEARPI